MATPAYRIANESELPGDNAQSMRDPRFFVQMGFDQMRVDTNAIQYVEPDGGTVYRMLPRGRIVPCVTYAHKTNIYEIREAELIPGSEEADRDGRVSWGKYWRFAGYEAQRLTDMENSTDHRSGLVEVRGLAGLARVLYGDRGSINNLFYPQGLDNLPVTNADMVDHLRDVVRSLMAKKPEGVDDMSYRAVIGIGEELIAATLHVDTLMRERLQFTHSCMKLQPTEHGFKRRYDEVDHEMLKRTGVPEIHAAEIQTAEALHLLAGRAVAPVVSNVNDGAVIEMLKAQLEQNNQLMRELMAQRSNESGSETVKRGPGRPPKQVENED